MSSSSLLSGIATGATGAALHFQVDGGSGAGDGVGEGGGGPETFFHPYDTNPKTISLLSWFFGAKHSKGNTI